MAKKKLAVAKMDGVDTRKDGQRLLRKKDVSEGWLFKVFIVVYLVLVGLLALPLIAVLDVRWC